MEDPQGRHAPALLDQHPVRGQGEGKEPGQGHEEDNGGQALPQGTLRQGRGGPFPPRSRLLLRQGRGLEETEVREAMNLFTAEGLLKKGSRKNEAIKCLTKKKELG